MRTTKINSITAETPKVKTFNFKDELCSRAKPGQFIMIWIPGVDEIPMSLSMLNPRKCEAAITAEKIGEATEALHKKKLGDTIGIRGPFGNSYTKAKNQKVMIVGGGTGLASLTPLVEHLAKAKNEVTLLMGAKTKTDLLFHTRIEKQLLRTKGQLIVTTEDGTFGQKSLVTTAAERRLQENKKYSMIYACGPEKMMYKMLLLAERFHIPFEASLERFMRCAIGICGTCTIGKYRVCQDVPVFSGKKLSDIKDEFGHWRRGFDGRKAAL